MAKQKLPKRKIEARAVHAIQAALDKCINIDDAIQVGDKEMLHDGEIKLYDSAGRGPTNLLGEIKVQVKGTTSRLRPNSRGYVKYKKVRIDHMEAYERVYGGIIFFLVAEDPVTGPKQIYYEKLLPRDIKDYLDKRTGDKTLTIKLRPFPAEPRDIVRICSSFLRDRQIQQTAEVTSYGLLDDQGNMLPEIRSFEFTKRLYADEPLASISAFMDRTYVYAMTTSGKVLSIDTIDDVRAVAMGTMTEVEAGDVSLRTFAYVGESTTGPYIEVDGLTLEISDGQAKIEFSIDGGIRRRQRTATITYEFLRSGLLQVGGHHIRVAPSEDTPMVERLCQERATYDRLAKALEALHIVTDWDPSQLTQEELNVLELMCKAFVDDEPIAKPTPDTPLAHFDIDGTRTFVMLQDLGDGLVKPIDMFSLDLAFVFGWPNDAAQTEQLGFDPVPPMLVCRKESFKALVNIPPNYMASYLERYPVTKGNHDALTEKLLDMLTTYDEGVRQPKAFLECCVQLAEALHRFDVPNTRAHINYLQALRRQRELTENEKDELRKIVASSKPLIEKSAASALLGDSAQARIFLEACDDHQRALLASWPIRLFYPHEADAVLDERKCHPPSHS